MEKENALKEILADEKLRNTLADKLTSEILKLNEKPKKRLSKWERGVWQYAVELVENLRWTQNGHEFFNYLTISRFDYARGKYASEKLFNACAEYSADGCSLIYDDDICERLATASERKRQTRKNGTLGMPNARENWIDVQARAIFQACMKIEKLAETLAPSLIEQKTERI